MLRLFLWWRWRDSNPRPKSLTADIYECSLLIKLSSPTLNKQSV